MCANTSTYFVVKMKFINYLKRFLSVVGFYGGVSSQRLLVLNNIPVVLMSQASCGIV